MSDNIDIINEYKDQVRILKQEVAELQDAGKSKDSANKRTLQKLENVTDDLEKAQEEIKKLTQQIKEKPNEKSNSIRTTIHSIFTNCSN